MKETFLDVGELGWSLYLSAHLRWLKSLNKPLPSVMLLPGREVFYRGLVEKVFFVPDDFYTTFDLGKQDRFGFLGTSPGMLRIYADSKLPKGYQISRRQAFTDDSWRTVFLGQKIFEPYEPGATLPGERKNKILIFPRCRKAEHFNHRNIPQFFYVALIRRLCEEFKDCTIRSMGTKNGAYEIAEAETGKENYSNFIDKSTIEELINFTPFAIGAVGAQSFPLKLMLLQGVPSFMIGHERDRHVHFENWQRTRAGFFEIGKDDYNRFYSEDCIDKIVEFLKEEK